MSVTPLVSIFIPAYNAAHFIRQAIDSVLAQTYSNYEVVIVDDASTDGTADVVAIYRQLPQVKIYHNAVNLGVAKNWNRGVSLCQGEFIVRLNADDLLVPDYLEQVVAAFAEHPQISMVFTGAHLIYNQKITTELPFRQSWSRPGVEFLPDLLRRCPVRASSVCLRRQCYHELGDVIESMDIHEDWEMWVRVAKHGQVSYIAKPLVYYRVLNPTGCTNQAIIHTRSPVACDIWLNRLSRDKPPYRLTEKELGLLKQGMYDIVMSFAVFAMEAGFTESVERHLAFARRILPSKSKGSMQARLYVRAAEIYFMEGGHYFKGWRFLLQSLKFGLPPHENAKYLKLWARALLGKTIFELVRENTVGRRRFPHVVRAD